MYPLEYSFDLVNFDIWYHMFLVGCRGSLTMHQFDTPPEYVLDLGCGGGHWVMEAAKQWPNSKITGFDMFHLYPDARKIRKEFEKRVFWQQGDFLEGLPFPPQLFDYVRIVGIGLGVPEDEWQHLLEEVYRVMKPGAVVEIVEEDLIFPCSTFRPRQPSHLSQASSFLSVASCSSSTTLCPESPEERWRTISSGTANKIYKALKLDDPKRKSMAVDQLSSNITLISSADCTTSRELKHPQDHTLLKAAWEAMLSRRFIPSKLLSVLPFYISSSSFVNVQTFPLFQVPLPPNSGTAPQLKPRPSHDSFMPLRRANSNNPFDLKPSPSSRSMKADGFCVRSTQLDAQPSTSLRAPMHLAKTFHTVKACEDAIWEEYETMYHDDPSLLTKRYLSSQDASTDPSPRAFFDADWLDWENDMTDRISMRNHLVGISWPETPGDRPDWRHWRSNLENNKSSLNGPSVEPTDSEDLCRSIRAFVAWKPKS